MTIDSRLQQLRQWYGDQARPFIASEAQDRLPTLDAAFDRLSVQAVPELPICFLGAAGVGKSTLLNALVGGHLAIVPQGGVGPLTAQATLIRYDTQRRFRATYLSARSLGNLLFALERSYEAEQRRSGAADPAVDAAPDLDEEDRDEIAAAAPVDLGPYSAVQAGVNLNDKIEGYLRQACLMILGTQYPSPEPDPRYLMDGLRICVGRAPRWGTTPRPEDQTRIERLQAALTAHRDHAYEVAAGSDLSAFLDELMIHASGHLAPMIRTLEVWWDADILKDGLVLVDLPGVGVANDEYRRVTAEWIRRARAVVLVVDRSGVTDASAELLRSTGFLNSLLHEGAEPGVDAATLFVAAVKLDLVASDERSADRERRGDQARKWISHFDEVCERMTQVIHGQMRKELERLCEDGAESTREARAAVVERVLAHLEVQPLTPYEFRMFLRNDEDDRPKIRNPEESRVPAFIRLLTSIGEERATRLRMRATEQYNTARTRTSAAIELIVEQWRAGERAAEEAARLRDELLRFADPLEKQMLVRQGQFRELLRNGMPREIEAHTRNAAADARRDILRHLRRYETYPWATLRAAIRKNGTFDGAKHVDLPNELTLRFEEPLAVVWSHKILVELRRATREISEDYAGLVGQIVQWARAQGSRVKPAIVEALHSELEAQAKDVGDVGKEAISDMKERVKTEIYETVEAEVRKRCMKFVKQKLDEGRGVKARMLEFLREELADAIVDAACPAALKVLETNFRRVEKEIIAAVGRAANPIQQAVEGLVSEHETQVKRSDAQRRRHVLARGEAALAATPPELSNEAGLS